MNDREDIFMLALWFDLYLWDLVISNYAFSELPKELQLNYFGKIISRSKFGYMTMNSGLNGQFGKIKNMSQKELINKIENSSIKPESPCTGDNNYIITWGE